MRTTLIIINLTALVGAIIWLIASPDWEPLVTSIVLLGGLITQFFPNTEWIQKIKFNIKAKKNSHTYQTAGDLTVHDNKKIQKTGDHSSSFQVEGDLVIGITEVRAREMAIEVFSINFLKLPSEAHNIALVRVEELVDHFLTKLNERNPESMDSLKDPGMQSALYTAQIEYAKTGDKDLEGTLVDMLVDRAALKDRELKQIVLDESISTIAKLTAQQLDILTLIFILTRTVYSEIVNLDNFVRYIKEHIIPFVPSLTDESSCYEHLVYSGCSSRMSVSSQGKKLEDILRKRYKAMFIKGFTKDEFENTIGKIEEYAEILIPCFHDSDKFQLIQMDEEEMEEATSKKGIEQPIINKLKQTYKQYLMTSEEAKGYLLKTTPDIEPLLNMWGNSAMPEMALTSVGIAIAQANYRRKTGESFELSIWIK